MYSIEGNSLISQSKASPRSVVRFDIDEEPEALGSERGSRERVYVTISVAVPGTCSTESSAPQSTRGEGSVRSASAHHRAKAGAHSGRRPRVRSLCRARRYRTHHAGATKFGGVGEHLAGPKNT